MVAFHAEAGTDVQMMVVEVVKATSVATRQTAEGNGGAVAGDDDLTAVGVAGEMEIDVAAGEVGRDVGDVARDDANLAGLANGGVGRQLGMVNVHSVDAQATTVADIENVVAIDEIVKVESFEEAEAPRVSGRVSGDHDDAEASAEGREKTSRRTHGGFGVVEAVVVGTGDVIARDDDEVGAKVVDGADGLAFSSSPPGGLEIREMDEADGRTNGIGGIRGGTRTRPRGEFDRLVSELNAVRFDEGGVDAEAEAKNREHDGDDVAAGHRFVAIGGWSRRRLKSRSNLRDKRPKRKPERSGMKGDGDGDEAQRREAERAEDDVAADADDSGDDEGDEEMPARRSNATPKHPRQRKGEEAREDDVNELDGKVG